MPAARRFAVLAMAAIMSFALPCFSANSAPRETIAAPSRMAIVVSMADGRTLIVAGRRVLAVAPLPDELAQRRQAPGPCDYGYRCDSAYGYDDDYFDGAYPPEIVLGGRDLELKRIEHPALPMMARSRAYDPTRDHWRILYERTGKLERNPSAQISTAALLAPLKNIDPVTTASTGRPLRIEITRRNHRMVTADIQKLLNRMGDEAGPTDGLTGPMTKAAILRFQRRRGIEPTGELTPSLIEAIYRAADAKQPESGRLVAMRGDKKILDTPIAIDDPQTPLGTHALMLSGSPKVSAPDWRLLTLSGRLAGDSPSLFHYDKGIDHATAARLALTRLHIPAEIHARLGRLSGPGTVLVLSDETAMFAPDQVAGPMWR